MKIWNRKGEEVEVSEKRFTASFWPMMAKFPKFITKELIEMPIPEGVLAVKDEERLLEKK